MRLTWLVLGVIVAAGAVAFINTDDSVDDLPMAEAGGDGAGSPGLNRETNASGASAGASGNRALSESEVKQEARAKGILQQMARASAEGNPARSEALASRLQKEAWDAPSARRWALSRGRQLLAQSELARSGNNLSAATIQSKDRARRLLSRVLYLPEMFTRAGASTDLRTQLIAQIQKLNRQVMLYGPGVEGVTRSYEVEPGIKPVQIISRQKLPMGANALLFWNKGMNLDPKRLRADETLMMPLETLSIHVYQRYRRMGLFMGDWFVKEFRVGIGKEETPTPLGTFTVHSRQRNPDWYPPGGGKRIRFGDPRNALGSTWIAIVSDEWPLSAGYGLHGTNAPKTVGTRCSNGCVRLNNAHASELYSWVRTASAGGEATRVYIQ